MNFFLFGEYKNKIISLRKNMRKIILLTDMMGIWIYNDRRVYKKLTDNFFKKYYIDLKVVEKVDKEIFPKLSKKGRKGKLKYTNVIEEYFKAIDHKNYKKLAKKYIEFEFNNISKYIKLYKHSIKTLSLLKKMDVKIVGVRDSVYSISEMKRILKILKIDKYFDKIYTSNSLKTEKPKMFIFFKDRKQKVFLGHENDEIIGAKKYKILTIGLKNKKADYYISSIKELPKVIKCIMRK